MPLEAVGDNYSPDPMYVWQWDHLNFKDVGGTWHGQLSRVLAGRGLRLSGAWCAPIGISAYQWQWGLMVAVYGVYLLLLGLIGDVSAYSGCWCQHGAVSAEWWQIGMAWHGVWWCLAPTWQGECLLH